ncbi:hypothetical protein B0J15DRAFT_374949, partial [Fusarium solani]
IPSLADPKHNGFKCTYASSCHFIGGIQKSIREHLRDAHSLQDQRGEKGRPAKSTSLSDLDTSLRHCRSGVSYQQLFPKSLRSENFKVQLSGSGLQPSDQIHLIDEFNARAQAIHQIEEERIDQPDAFSHQLSDTQPNEWVMRLGVTRHLKDFAGK